MVQLTEELRRALDQEASLRGVSRSAIIREAVTQYLASSKQASIAEAIVEGYRRIPPGTPDEWGDLAAQVDAATDETLQRLRAEERARGLEPW